jgi:hypothetical protein
MSFEDELRRVEEHVAEARRMVHRQKGLIIRFGAAGVSTWDAQRILWLLESNLRRLEEHSAAGRVTLAGSLLFSGTLAESQGRRRRNRHQPARSQLPSNTTPLLRASARSASRS